MDITERIAQTEQTFENIQTKREEHLKAADECLTEMTKLQGEWRVLKELVTEPEDVKQEDPAKTIKAKAEKSTK